MNLVDLERLVQRKFPAATLSASGQMPEQMRRGGFALPVPHSMMEFLTVNMWDEAVLDVDDQVDDCCESVTDIIQLASDWRVVGIETAGIEGIGYMLSTIFFVRGRDRSIEKEMEAWYEGQRDRDRLGFELEDLIDDAAEEDEDEDDLPPWSQPSESWKRA